MLTTTLQLAGRRVHLVLHPEDCRSCWNHKRHKPVDQLTFLTSELALAVHRDGPLLADLRTLVAASPSVYSPSRVPDVDIVQQLSTLLQSGRLMAIDCRLPVEERSVKSVEAPPINPRAVLPPRPIKNEAPTKTWIEIALVDARGKPVPNQKYRIKLTDGQTHEGMLDAKGRARFDEIDPGNCDIWFPEIDAREWKDA
jgi:hypothetical protein